MRNDLHHVAVFVDELDRTIHLFKDFLGFEVAWRLSEAGGRGLSEVMGVPEMKAEIAYLRSGSGGTALELIRIIPASLERDLASRGASNPVVLSLIVENLEGLHLRLSDAGWIPFTRAVEMMSPDGYPIRMFCFAADNGLTIELIEPAKTVAG